MNTSSPNVSREIFFGEDELIVSKTDLRGKITYGNEVFYRLAEYSEAECIGQPHSMVRHPDMPRCVFNLLWETIQAGREIFAYVKNRSKSGNYYWVHAHVTPSYDRSGSVVGFHSNRRVPNRKVLEDVIIPLYRSLLKEEQRHGSRKDGMQLATQLLLKTLEAEGKSYDEFIHSL